MIRIEHSDWSGVSQVVKHIRKSVFVYEWRIPKDIEFDLQDSLSEHVVVFDDDRPLATGRLCPDGYVSRVAVLPKGRETDAANHVFSALLAIARSKQMPLLTISSDIEHLEIVKQAGFTSLGRVYMEAGVARQKLACPTKHFKPVSWDWLH